MNNNIVENNLFYEDLYDKLYSIGYHNSETISHTIPVLRILFKHGIKINSVLDCGSSIGNALLFLQQKNIKAEGLEISCIATEIANKRGLKTIQGSVTKIPHKNNSFELVICCDVLEHLKEEDVGFAIDESIRVSSKYICLKPCPHPEKNKKPLEDLIEKYPEYGSITNLHLTTRELLWYIDLINKLNNKYNFKINNKFFDQGIILIEKI